MESVAPPLAQRKRFEFSAENVVEAGQITKAKYHRRVPYFLTLIRRGFLDADLEQVLGWYRDRWDASNYSIVHDSLGKHQARTGGSGNYELWRARILDAASDVRFAEAGVAPFLRGTLGLMVLEDVSAKTIAQERHAVEKPTDEQVKRIMAELHAAGFQMLAQVRHILG